MRWTLYCEYYKRFWRTVLGRTFLFWKGQIAVGLFAAPVAVLISYRLGATPKSIVRASIESAVIGYLIVLGGYFLVALAAAPALLDLERQTQINRQKTTIESLTDEIAT